MISGPPELPGLMAASVWIAFVEIVWPSSVCKVTVRLRLEIIPRVTVFAKTLPNGLPIAIAVSPTLIVSELANSAIVVTLSAAILITAMSEKVSAPTSSPLSFSPEAKSISIFSAPEITWLFVTIYAVSPSFL